MADGKASKTPAGNFFIPGALRDLSVSRSSFTWGIPVPEPAASETKQKHVIYVWLDALANYMTALGYGSEDESNFKKFWPAELHLVGKEIIRFHCVYWPAFLLAAGLPLPKAVTAHGWLLFDDTKMSKSKGNIVRTETILDAFGTEVYAKQFPESAKREQDLFSTDVLRYFLLREIPFGSDGSFNFDALITRYNADLANGYGNLVSRTLKQIQQHQGGAIVVPSQPWLYAGKTQISERNLIERTARQITETDSVISVMSDFSRIQEFYEENRLEQLATYLSTHIQIVDIYLSSLEPWKLIKNSDETSQRGFVEVIYTAAESIRIITALLYPILPNATGKVWAQLGLGDIELASKNGELKDLTWGGLQPGTKLGPLAPIFPRADKGLAQIMIDIEASKAPKPTVTDETITHPFEPEDPLHPAAGPRTATFTEPNPGATVAGSNAVSTDRETPSHVEATASIPFAASAAASANPSNSQIGIEDFVKIDLRVAQIIVAERIPKADKLLRLEVDLGYEKRQILSGIAQWYTPEELIGRRIVIVANLAPRKMRGLESHGMLLAASAGEDGKPVLATFGEEIALGSRLK